MSEQVLAILRESVPDFDGLNYRWLLPDPNEIVDYIGKMLPRDEAEHNEDFKQIIPYILIADPELRKLVCYQRTKLAGEKRLHGKSSIGFGGHINTKETLEEAALRELKEETGLEGQKLYPVAWLNDDSTEVGRVHLGLICVTILNEPVTCIRESGDISLIGWVSIPTLQSPEWFDCFEDWSKTCIRHLPKILSKI